MMEAILVERLTVCYEKKFTDDYMRMRDHYHELLLSNMRTAGNVQDVGNTSWVTRDDQ